MMNYDDDGGDELPPFQWIFHFECLHFLSKVYPKEFCGYCIQTGESILYYIKTPGNILLDLAPAHVSAFASQTSRHGFVLSDGDLTIQEFREKVCKYVSKDCTIYASCQLVERYFSTPSKFSYPDIINLHDILPCNYKKILNMMPNKVCARNHSTTHCAQKTVNELVRFLRPALVPYLNSSIIIKQCSTTPNEVMDNEQVKYGKHYLKPPYYRTLSTVNLLAGCVDEALDETAVADRAVSFEDCEYSLEG